MANMEILIVDDSLTARMMVQKFLNELGLGQAHVAEDGAQALLKAQKLAPLDLITLDWNMPEMDGFELLKALRENPQFAQTKILMITTETGMTKMVDALEAGANEYIMKPFTCEMLAEKLQIMGLEV